MAINRYDYSTTLDPWYRRKGLTGIAPSINTTYGQLAALNEDTRQREEMGARLGLQQQQINLAANELKFAKRQANIANLFGGVAFAHQMRGAYGYGKEKLTPYPTPGVPELSRPGALASGYQPQTFSLGGAPTPPAGSALYPGTNLSYGFDQGVPSLTAGVTDFDLGGAAGGFGGGEAGGAAGGATLTPPLTPGSAAQPYQATAPGMFAPGSLAAEAGGGVAGAAVTAGAGIAGGFGGRALGSWIAKQTGMHEKTVSDIGSALGTFAAVTAATGNPVLGVVAGAVDAIFSLF